jgi:DNA-binding transcriptional MerR regulator
MARTIGPEMSFLGTEDFIMPMIIKKDWLTIGEVSDLTGVPIHTLRYWETEFNGYFSPIRTSGRQRRYNEDAVGKVQEIKNLLKEEKYSIAGARQVLSRKVELGEGMLTNFNINENEEHPALEVPPVSPN